MVSEIMTQAQDAIKELGPTGTPCTQVGVGLKGVPHRSSAKNRFGIILANTGIYTKALRPKSNNVEEHGFGEQEMHRYPSQITDIACLGSV